jgi:predicted RNA-binding protein YlxR (DUF448 family)
MLVVEGQRIKSNAKLTQRFKIVVVASSVREVMGRGAWVFSKNPECDAEVDCRWLHHASKLATTNHTHYRHHISSQPD